MVARPAQQQPDADADAGALSDLLASGPGPQVPAFGGGMLTRPSLAEQVTNRIIAMIKGGNLKAGDRLPTEQQMGIAFGISRPPLREALKALTLMGVLESRQGGRYTVTDLSPGRLMAPFYKTLSFADYNAQDHFESRTVVDLALVRLCTERASPDERRRILAFAVDGRAFYGDPVGFRLLDIELHQALHNGAHNPLLAALAQTLYDVGLDVRRLASALPGVIETSVDQHVEIASAVMAGDAETAVAAYRRHLVHVRDTTLQLTG